MMLSRAWKYTAKLYRDFYYQTEKVARKWQRMYFASYRRIVKLEAEIDVLLNIANTWRASWDEDVGDNAKRAIIAQIRIEQEKLKRLQADNTKLRRINAQLLEACKMSLTRMRQLHVSAFWLDNKSVLSDSIEQLTAAINSCEDEYITIHD